MPNAIKYSLSAQTLALKKGNFYIGTGDVGKGPTSTTDYYNGITPPSGGYTIYLNKASGGPSIYTASNDSQLISLSNTIAGQTFATAAAALDWFATQTDKMVFNRDYPSVITNGLVLNLDAGFTPSYPTTGTTWYDVSSGGNNGALTNGPTFNSSNGGGIVFDGTNDYCDVGVGLLTSSTSLTVELIAKFTDDAYTMTGGMSTYGACYPYFYGGGSGFEGYAATYNRPSSISPYTGLGSFGMLFQSGPQYSTSVSNISMNVPYIITSIFSPTIVALYVNGNFASSSPAGNPPNFDGNGLRIGSGNKSFNGFFNGTIYSCKQYSRALSSAEILQNYNAQKSRYGL
jgi:hypothetical protein